ncbi:MAG: SDR family oxidoreductase [Deltaproteobacteria bacterium]|nr:SDR family oxidoreductase [Deltaproteobacteria bacterium]
MSEPLFRLDGQVALVTGATRGIGRATAQVLAAAGAQVVVAARHGDEASRTADEIARAHGVRALGLSLDVRDSAAAAHAMAQLLAWSQGRLDIVVNNAGYPVDDELWDTPLHAIPTGALNERFLRVYSVDLQGARNVTHAALPTLMQARRGALVYVSSTPALAGHKATPYTEAKAGVLGLMRDVARTYGPYNIRANAVAPGNIATGWEARLSEVEQHRLAREAFLGRWGEPAEVATAIAFLASPMAGYITGQTLVVDGGTVVH